MQRSDETANSRTGLIHTYRIGTDLNAPLALLVHGRAGDASVMWAFRRTIPDSWNIIAVQAPIPDPIGGFSWWLVNPPPASLLEVAARAGEILCRFLVSALEYYGLTPKFKVALGFSQGAGTLSVVLQHQPTLFAGTALLAGFVVEAAPETVPLVPQPSVFMGNGTEDTTVSIDTARQGAAYLRARGANVQMVEDSVGHKIGTTAMRALTAGDWYKNFVV